MSDAEDTAGGIGAGFMSQAFGDNYEAVGGDLPNVNFRDGGEETGLPPLPALDVHSWSGVLNLGTGAELPLYMDLSHATDGDTFKPGRVLQQYLQREPGVFSVKV